MELACTRPCCSSSAIHSASFTSVLRPGTLLMWGRVDHHKGELVLQKVVHLLPVDPVAPHAHMAHIPFLEPSGHGQKLPGEGAEGTGFPASGVMTQASTDFLCTSKPQQRPVKSIHRSHLISTAVRWVAARLKTLLCSPPKWGIIHTCL